MSETVPLDQFIATSNAALTYKAERDALAAQVSTLQQERDTVALRLWAEVTRARAAEAQVSTLRELLAVMTDSHAQLEDLLNDLFADRGMPRVSTSPVVVEARAALASTPGDPDAST